MAVIELAKPGQEATTYELLVTVGNSAILVNGIVATQLLTAFNGVTCEDSGGDTSSCVDTTTADSYVDSDGPARFTKYTLVLNAISVIMVSVFVRFLPRTKEECQEWKELGEQLGTSTNRGRLTLAMVTVVIIVSSNIFFFVIFVVHFSSGFTFCFCSMASPRLFCWWTSTLRAWRRSEEPVVRKMLRLRIQTCLYQCLSF